LKGALTGQPFARPAFAGPQDDARHGSRGADLSSYSAFAPRPAAAGRRRAGPARPALMGRMLRTRLVGFALATLFFGGVGLYGAMRGGQYDDFVAANGSPLDTAAKALGFGLESITIVGSRGLYETEVLATAGITGRNSLPFLDVAEVRDRLREIPLIKDVWHYKFFKIAGVEMSLDEVEHSILRKEFEEPRIHFAINCASVSCPPLLNEAFMSANLENQLTRVTTTFINDPTRNKISSQSAQLSSIFSWFKGDFTKKGTLIEFLNRYAKVKLSPNARITFMEYNWNLNE
jgi:hypothetical protein